MRYDEVVSKLNAAQHGEWLRNDELGIFTLETDIDVRVHEVHSEEERIYTEPWATNLPDPEAFKVIYDLYYGASFLERFYFVSVDGGRAAIPYPKGREDLRITSLQYAIGVAVDLTDSLDEYLERCGIKRI